MNRTRLLPLAALPVLYALNVVPPGGVGQPGTHPAADPLDADRAIASFFPESTLLLAEAPALPALLDAGFEHPVVAGLLASPLGEALLAEAEFTPEAGLAFVDALLGRPLLPALASVTRRGAAFGVLPRRAGNGQAQWVFAALGDDDLVTEELLDRALTLVGAEHGTNLSEPTDTHAGADVWNLGDELFVARRDALFLASNDAAALRKALDLDALPDERGLFANPEFASDRATLDGSELVWSWFDRARTQELLNAFGAGEGLEKLGAANREPEAQYLLGPGLSALGTGARLVGSASIEGGAISFELRSRGAEEASVVAPALPGDERSPAAGGSPTRPAGGSPTRPAGGSPTLPAGVLREGAASAVVYRDLAGLWSHRQELFPADRGPALVRGMNQLGLFFGGLDLPEEVLPTFSPWLRLVSAPVSFTEGAEPELPLPALAVMVDLEDAEFGPRLTAAFQGLIGVIGVDRAQKGEAPLVLHVASRDGVELSYASYPKPRPGDGVDLRYNLEPACASVGSTFVLATHRDIAERIVRDLVAGDTVPAPGAGVVERLDLPGSLLRAALEPNREALVMQGVYEEGKTLEESRGDIDGLIALSGLLERIELELTYEARGELVLALRMPLTPETLAAERAGESLR